MGDRGGELIAVLPFRDCRDRIHRQADEQQHEEHAASVVDIAGHALGKALRHVDLLGLCGCVFAVQAIFFLASTCPGSAKCRRTMSMIAAWAVGSSVSGCAMQASQAWRGSIPAAIRRAV